MMKKTAGKIIFFFLITIAASSAILFHSCIQLAQVGDVTQPCFNNNTCLPGLGCVNGYCQNSGYTWTDPNTGIEWMKEAGRNMSWSEASGYCNSMNLKQSLGWHLPSVDEMRTIIDGCPNMQPGGGCGVTNSCLATSCKNNCGCSGDQCFRNSNLSGDCGNEWTASMVSNNQNSAWVLYFYGGSLNTNSTSNNYGVRCARSGSPGDGGFSDGGGGKDGGSDGGYDGGGGGTWTDVTTGLEWMQYAGTFMGQQQAFTYCGTSTYAGKTGWRLPTINELRTILQGCSKTTRYGSCTVNDGCLDTGCRNADCSGCTAFLGPGPGGCYWDVNLSGSCQSYWTTLVPTNQPGYAWSVDYSNGSINIGLQSYGYYVRCVR